jgi:hypothetical protein
VSKKVALITGVTGQDGTLEIMLTISHPNSPLDCKVSDDLRKLGIRCFSLELNASELISI